MQSIINSIIKNRNLIIYLFLSFVTFNYLYNNSSVHYSGFGKAGTFISGSTSSIYSYINSYFNLRQENNKLIEENLELKKYESQFIDKSDTIDISESKIDKTISAKVILNSINKSKNIINNIRKNITAAPVSVLRRALDSGRAIKEACTRGGGGGGGGGSGRRHGVVRWRLRVLRSFCFRSRRWRALVWCPDRAGRPGMRASGGSWCSWCRPCSVSRSARLIYCSTPFWHHCYPRGVSPGSTTRTGSQNSP